MQGKVGDKFKEQDNKKIDIDDDDDESKERSFQYEKLSELENDS